MAFPKTIEDAVTVTLSLGFEYLWVDALCIQQSKKDDLGKQLQQMDLIYRLAKITIIAAAGHDAYSGLSGISTARPSRQARFEIQDLCFTTIISRPWDEVVSSTWNSRGWTFQESVMSTRCLLFTKSQLILDCRHQWICESVKDPQPPTVSSVVDGQYWRIQHSLDACAGPIYHLINEYTPRNLTKSEDILNAFSGILRAFRVSEDPVHDYWGIPVFLGKEVVLPSFLFGLQWETTYDAFQPPRKQFRRNFFPSWSWTGFIQPAFYRSYLTPGRNRFLPRDGTRVSVEYHSGAVMPLTDVLESFLLDKPVTRFITLEAWATRVELRGHGVSPGSWEDHSQPMSFLPFNCLEGKALSRLFGRYQTFGFHAVLDGELHGMDITKPFECVGVWLGSMKDDHNFGDSLVLLREHEGFWERIGIVNSKGGCSQDSVDMGQFPDLRGWDRYELIFERRIFRLG